VDSIIIQGGIPLTGTVNISGAKNASLPILAAALLTDQELEISNVPKLSDISLMRRLLISHGATIEEQDKPDDSWTLKIQVASITSCLAHYDIVRRMRASIWVLGPLLARSGQAKVSLPGGCAIGTRQVDLHIGVLTALGATIKIEEGYIQAKVKGRLKGTHFSFSKISVGATITALLAAVLADGDTYLLNCAKEPEIIDLCHCLNQMGADIYNIGSDELVIKGKERLRGTKYQIMPDRIEAGTYMIAAMITRGDIKVQGINPHIIENLILPLQAAGADIESADNAIRVKHQGIIRPTNIYTHPYPGFATDFQAQFMALMTLSSGGSALIVENIFENRFMHVPELSRMGANITVSGNQAIIQGVESLNGAEVMASDLRASVSLIIAGLAASGVTKVRRIYHLDRGYHLLEQKLAKCGANIQRISGDQV
jgi:UDP-N-acetylglucosamine 1-carboxyvinyltransferase